MAGTIKGTVYDEANGEPLVAVTVQLSTTGQVQFTDVNGSFTFRNVANGTSRWPKI